VLTFTGNTLIADGDGVESFYGIAHDHIWIYDKDPADASAQYINDSEFIRNGEQITVLDITYTPIDKAEMPFPDRLLLESIYGTYAYTEEIDDNLNFSSVTLSMDGTISFINNGVPEEHEIRFVAMGEYEDWVYIYYIGEYIRYMEGTQNGVAVSEFTFDTALIKIALDLNDKR
jgi:hypothetical protein